MTAAAISPSCGWTPYIVGVAPNGARKTQSDHPALPMTAAELARTAAACCDAGASYLHLHVRDRDGRHILDADAYRDASEAIRQEVGDDMVIQITTEAVGLYNADQQMAVVREVRPESASVAVREIVPDESSESAAAEFFAWMRSESVLPQFILYADADVARFRDLCRRGVVPGNRHFVLFVLGRYSADQQSMPVDLLPFLKTWSVNGDWSICAFGRHENACALTAAALGGHSRVGFENNILMADGKTAPENAALVAQARLAAELIGRPMAVAADVRELTEDAAR